MANPEAMANPEGSNSSEFVETITRIHLQRQDAQESAFQRTFPLLILVALVIGMIAITSQRPATIQNNHNIEVTR